MTTIAYRNGVLAADSQMTYGDIRCVSSKIFLFPDGVVATAGDWAAGRKFVQWWKEGKPEKQPDFGKENFWALVMTKTGIEAWNNLMHPVPVEDEFTADGSGAGLAMGAMHMGASAVQAIEAAIRFDINTGGRVVSYSRSELKGRRR